VALPFTGTRPLSRFEFRPADRPDILYRGVGISVGDAYGVRNTLRRDAPVAVFDFDFAGDVAYFNVTISIDDGLIARQILNHDAPVPVVETYGGLLRHLYDQ
jgi:hypothetical protein